MKFLPSQLAYFLQNKTTRRNIRALARFLLVLSLLVITYSVVFHYLMAAEGAEHSWITGFYWTLTVMSTLGFGDITFHSDMGRAFSIIVLFSGIIFLLILLPFTFIQFFYAPWLEARTRSHAPRYLPADSSGHVLLTFSDPVGMSLIEKLRSYQTPYALLVEDLKTALDLHEAGIRVVLGDRDDPETYRKLQIDKAALVVANGSDESNTNIVYTVRELNPDIPVISLADSPNSVDIMALAGSTFTLQLREMLGKALARRTVGGETQANIIGRFDELVIAETPVNGTHLVGMTLGKSRLREMSGVNVVGVWDRGVFQSPRRETAITNSTVLVLAGTEAQLARFDKHVPATASSSPYIIILGGGRVGRHVAAALRERGLDHVIIERNPAEIRDDSPYVLGSAADLGVLQQAGIERATSVVITTQSDDTNIYLTIYCRHLRPDVHIISRTTMDRNISTLHRAGADLVLSYASLGSNAIINYLQHSRIMMLAEGLDILRIPVPSSLQGKTLQESNIRAKTECSVIVLRHNDNTIINPEPKTALLRDMEMLIIGSISSIRNFLGEYNITLSDTFH
ncbi:MAG: potassium channel protein [Bacteroidetes bacterium]|nr:potassium channel protein [Bacteroidota bacterium]